MPDIPVAQQNLALDAILVPGQSYYLSLHNADPGLTGASELTDVGYLRQLITFNSASGGNQVSQQGQTFTLGPQAGAVWVGIWTAAIGGTFVWGNPTPAAPGPFALGATQVITAGTIISQME